MAEPSVMRSKAGSRVPMRALVAVACCSSAGLAQISVHEEPRVGEPPAAAAPSEVCVVAPGVGDALLPLIRTFLEPQEPGAVVTSTGVEPARSAIVLEVVSDEPTLWILRARYRGRTWVRRIPGPAQDAAALEAAASILARAAASLIEAERSDGQQALEDWTPADTPPSAAAPGATGGDPAPPTPTRAPERVDASPARRGQPHLLAALELAYRAQYYATTLPLTSGVDLGFSLEHSRGPCGRVGGSLYPPNHVATSDGSFDVSRFPVGLDLGYCFRVRRWAAAAMLGGFFEPTLRSAAVGASGVGATPDTWLVGGGVRGRIHACFDVGPRLGLCGGLGVEVHVIDQVFVDGEGTPLLSPENFRPFLELGIQVRLLD